MVDRHHPGKAPMALLQILRDGSCRTIEALEGDLDLTRVQISNAAAILLKRDLLLRMARGCYQLSDAGLKAAEAGEVITCGPKGAHGKPRIVKDTIRERAWRAMRIRRRFTLHDLIADAQTEADSSPYHSLSRYLRALRQAGYVGEAPRRLKGTAPTSNGVMLLCLLRNTGPRAPVVRSVDALVHDPNTGEDVPCIRS